MIHWLWLLPAIFLSASMGIFICALFVAARNQDAIEDMIDDQPGCVCQHEAVCPKQTDAH